jgi:hypothetical protein
MYKTLVVYSQIYVKIYIKNRGETVVRIRCLKECATEGWIGIA